MAVPVAGPPADRPGPGGPDRVGQLRLAGALGERAERDRVRELGDGEGVAESDETGEPDRIQLVAGEQPGCRRPRRPSPGASGSAAGSPRRSPLRAARNPRPGRRYGGRRRAGRRDPPWRAPAAPRRPRRGARPRAWRSALQPPAGARAGARACRRSSACSPRAPTPAEASAAKAPAAASRVRSICCSPCAREGNHASNCEGGGYTPRARASRDTSGQRRRGRTHGRPRRTSPGAR